MNGICADDRADEAEHHLLVNQTSGTEVEIRQVPYRRSVICTKEFVSPGRQRGSDNFRSRRIIEPGHSITCARL